MAEQKDSWEFVKELLLMGHREGVLKPEFQKMTEEQIVATVEERKAAVLRGESFIQKKETGQETSS